MLTATQDRPIYQTIAIAALGVAVLTASSYISVPMYPVPVTMQTLAVLLMGFVLGPRLGAAIVISWLGLAMMGAPVLSGGKSGLVAFTGPTAGYLASFPIAAFLAGLLPKSDRLSAHIARFAGALVLHVAILAAGFVWLSKFVGAEAAFLTGVTPFLIGALLKSALAVALFAAWKGFEDKGYNA